VRQRFNCFYVWSLWQQLTWATLKILDWLIDCFVLVFRGNGGSDCVSESASNDGVTAGEEATALNGDNRQATSSDVNGYIDGRHQIGPSASVASSTARRHEYHQISGFDAHYTAPSAAVAAAVGGYLPGTSLSCIPPYFTTTTSRASVFHRSNQSLDPTAGLYSMQQAWHAKYTLMAPRRTTTEVISRNADLKHHFKFLRHDRQESHDQHFMLISFVKLPSLINSNSPLFDVSIRHCLHT